MNKISGSKDKERSQRQQCLQQTAEVIKKHADKRIEVKFNNGRIIKVKTAKRLKKLVIGDRVIVEIPLQDLNSGTIVRIC